MRANICGVPCNSNILSCSDFVVPGQKGMSLLVWFNEKLMCATPGSSRDPTSLLSTGLQPWQPPRQETTSRAASCPCSS